VKLLIESLIILIVAMMVVLLFVSNSLYGQAEQLVKFGQIKHRLERENMLLKSEVARKSSFLEIEHKSKQAGLEGNARIEYFKLK
jgi:biopolymer transport protein ExbB/TolQ